MATQPLPIPDAITAVEQTRNVFLASTGQKATDQATKDGYLAKAAAMDPTLATDDANIASAVVPYKAALDGLLASVQAEEAGLPTPPPPTA